MLVSTRSGTSNRRERDNLTNASTNGSTFRGKTTRRAILLLIRKVIYIRLQKSNRRRGVIRQTFNEYHQRYERLIERQVRYALTKYKEVLKVSSIDESVLETNKIFQK